MYYANKSSIIEKPTYASYYLKNINFKLIQFFIYLLNVFKKYNAK
jgi:hypothetical protein